MVMNITTGNPTDRSYALMHRPLKKWNEVVYDEVLFRYALVRLYRNGLQPEREIERES